MRLAGLLVLAITGIQLLSRIAAQSDPHLGCLTVSTFDGTVSLVDLGSGQSLKIASNPDMLSRRRNIPSPSGDRSIYVMWASNGNYPSDWYKGLARASIGTPTNPSAIPLDDVYIERGAGGILSSDYFSATWTPDGKLLYTWISRDSRYYLTRVDADGTHKQTLALDDPQIFPPGSHQAVWSTDGAYFTTVTRKAHNNLLNIWSASDLHLVASFVADDGVITAEWSHSGHRLFYGATSQVYPFVIALPDTASAILIPYIYSFDTQQTKIEWSSDDQWILAYSSFGEPTGFVFNTYGTLVHTLTGRILEADFDHLRFVLLKDWPEDYDGTVRKSFKEWDVVYLNSGITETIAKDVLFYLPDPKTAHRYVIAWQRNVDEKEIDLIAEGGVTRQYLLTVKGKIGEDWIERIEWSPDSSKIVVAWWYGPKEHLTLKLSLLGADGTLYKQIDDIKNWILLESGRKLAYVDYKNQRFTAKIYDVVSGQEQTLLDSVTNLIISKVEPQADRFLGLYLQADNENREIDVYDADGKRVYHVLIPTPRETDSLVRFPNTFYELPDNQFIFAYNSVAGLSFVRANSQIVSVAGQDFLPDVLWSRCEVESTLQRK